MFLRKKNTLPTADESQNPVQVAILSTRIILLGDRWYLRYPLSYRNAPGNDAGVGIICRPCNTFRLKGKGERENE